MKLLVVSHACSVAINQQFYADVQSITNWDVTLLVPSNWLNEYGQRVASRWPSFKGEIIERPVRKTGNIVLHFYRASMKSLLRSVAPDAIYVHNEPYALATGQTYWANKRSIQKPIGFYSAQNINKRYPLPFRMMEKMVYRNSNFAFPITSAVDGVLREKGYSNPSTLLPLGIDPLVHRPYDDKNEIRAKMGIKDGQIVIGYLGRLVEEKGLGTLLRALALIKDMLSWRMVIIGAGPYEGDLVALAEKLGLTDRISRLPYVPHPEAPKYLSSFDITVLPSETRSNWKEQFGRVIVESLACGTMVLGSDSGEIGNLIKQTGGGRIFEEKNPDSLAAELRQLLANSDERARFAETGREAVMRTLTNASLAEKFVDTIERAIHQAK